MSKRIPTYDTLLRAHLHAVTSPAVYVPINLRIVVPQVVGVMGDFLNRSEAKVTSLITRTRSGSFLDEIVLPCSVLIRAHAYKIISKIATTRTWSDLKALPRILDINGRCCAGQQLSLDYRYSTGYLWLAVVVSLANMRSPENVCLVALPKSQIFWQHLRSNIIRELNVRN